MILSYMNAGTVIRLTLQRPRGKVMCVICVSFMSNKEEKQSAGVDVCGQAAAHVPQGPNVNLIKRVSSHFVRNISGKDS